ncbi:cytidylyltransferase domain-containing protein [uncultured Sunxiuqinia sp.]|uniref:cytidylyltransferase domain-containing protein n=1 Tax=uncultured Sunxiuqinia sp. TaxID=1573825 RepID=UPI002AA7F5FF|nr:hypothetical protein [uncultured Sunxiuqinia sp.]
MIGIIIQARIGSTRLPQKMVLPFHKGKGILETILIRLRERIPDIPIILATTSNSRDDKIEKIALNNSISVFRGSETNVLDRFIKAAKRFKINKIIRICADNPFLDINAIKFQISDFKNSNVDYWCYSKNEQTPTIKTHFGFWTEGITLEALEKIKSKTNKTVYQEHVTNYVYMHPNSFKIHFEPISLEIEKQASIRLTIDTTNDFETAKEIYAEINRNNISLCPNQIINFVISNAKWVQSMETEILKNTK